MNPRIFVLVAVLLGGMGQGVVAPKLPELLAGSGSWLVLSSGLSATLMYFGVFVSTYYYGRRADRGGVHWLLGLGLLAYGATLLCLGRCTTPTSIFGLRFLEGLAISAVYVAADFVLGRLSKPNERGQWLSYYGVALSCGLLLGPALALGSSAIIFSSSAFLPLAIVAALVFCLAIPAFAVRVPKLLDEPTLATQAVAAAPLFSGAVYGFMEAGLVAVFPVLAVREFNVRPEYCLLTVIVSAALSSVGWGYAADHRGAGKTVRELLVFLAAGTATLGLCRVFLGNHAAAYASCVFFGLVAGGLYPVGFSWLLEGMPENQYGFASGSFARAYGLGSLFGPLTLGWASQYFGSRGLFWGIAAIAFVGVAVVYADFFSGKVSGKPLRRLA